MIDVVMPAIAVDRPIVQQTAVASMLHGEGVAVAVVAVTVIGGAAEHHDIGDIDKHARQRILRLGLRAQRDKAQPDGDCPRGPQAGRSGEVNSSYSPTYPGMGRPRNPPK